MPASRGAEFLELTFFIFSESHGLVRNMKNACSFALLIDQRHCIGLIDWMSVQRLLTQQLEYVTIK